MLCTQLKNKKDYTLEWHKPLLPKLADVIDDEEVLCLLDSLLYDVDVDVFKCDAFELCDDTDGGYG